MLRLNVELRCPSRSLRKSYARPALLQNLLEVQIYLGENDYTTFDRRRVYRRSASAFIL